MPAQEDHLDRLRLTPRQRQLYLLLIDRDWVPRREIEARVFGGYCASSAVSTLLLRTQQRLTPHGMAIERDGRGSVRLLMGCPV